MDLEKTSGTHRFLTLTLGEGLFALDIFAVREILDMAEITRIPQTPDFMRGVVNVRGAAIPVMDLRLKFGMGQVEKTLNTRIIILELKRESGLVLFGVMADSVKEVLEIDGDSIGPPPSMGSAVRADFIKGIAKHGDRFILILEVEKVFSTEEILNVSAVMEEVPEGLGDSTVQAASGEGPDPAQ